MKRGADRQEGCVIKRFRPYVQVFSNLYFPTTISFLYHVETTVKGNLDLWTGKVLAMVVNVAENLDRARVSLGLIHGEGTY